MLAHLSPVSALSLVVLTASGYAVATVGMKLASGAPSALAIAFICVGLLGAVLAEVVLLRHASLTLIYIGIVVFESLLVLAYASLAAGTLNIQQMAGAVLVLGGFALVSLAE